MVQSWLTRNGSLCEVRRKKSGFPYEIPTLSLCNPSISNVGVWYVWKGLLAMALDAMPYWQRDEVLAVLWYSLGQSGDHESKYRV